MGYRGYACLPRSLAALAGGGLLLAMTMALPQSAGAQQAVGVDPTNRHCQTILTCNFRRGGSYRGCLSSYTCRSCRLVRTRCTGDDLASGRRQCQEFVCSWGG